MNEKPFTPPVAKDMVDEGKSFAETAAGKQLQGELLMMKEKLEAAEKEMKDNLAKFQQKEKALSEEMEKTKKEAKERQEKLEKDLDEKMEKMAQEARDQREADAKKLKDMQNKSDEERRQMQRDADKRASDLQDRHERERRELMASQTNASSGGTDQLARLEKLINSTRKMRTEDAKELKRLQNRLDRTNNARATIATKRLKCPTGKLYKKNRDGDWVCGGKHFLSAKEYKRRAS